MTAIPAIFDRDKALIGMVHVRALPGTPGHELSMDTIIGTAVDEARVLADAGFDGVIVENMHDVPYLLRDVGPDIIASMTAVARAVRDAVSCPMGVQILAGANQAALAVAYAAQCQFIRAEGFVFASVADEGLLAEADAGPLLRYREQIGAQDIRIFADVKKKHSSHALTDDIDLAATIRAAEFCRADGVIITGRETGMPVSDDDLRAAREAAQRPLLIGSGATPDTIERLLTHADGVIVGSALKRDGDWRNELDPDRIAAFIERALR